MIHRMNVRPLTGTRMRVPNQNNLEGVVIDVIREKGWTFLLVLDDGTFREVAATSCALAHAPDGSPYRS